MIANVNEFTIPWIRCVSIYQLNAEEYLNSNIVNFVCAASPGYNAISMLEDICVTLIILPRLEIQCNSVFKNDFFFCFQMKNTRNVYQSFKMNK